MRTAPAASPTGLTVDELTAYREDKFRQDPILAELVVHGELLEFKRHTSGHVYFTLGGSRSRLSGVMFRSDASLVPEWPRKGDEVLVRGQISVYAARGTYQVYARRLFPLGQGAMARAREELRRRLEAEGLFDPRRKRPLPPMPLCVAVVTSPTGAAVRDVVKVARVRFPQARLVVVPALVQGLDAAASIAGGLRRAAGVDGADLVILARGGGSRDDLNPFDDEESVRAVASCPLPVVTGVGHQVDTTLCDLAADFVTATPSAAAERVFPDVKDLSKHVATLGERMGLAVSGRIRSLSDVLEQFFQRAVRTVRRGYLLPAFERTDDLKARLGRGARSACEAQRQRLASQAGLLQGLSPLFPLSRGYAVVEDAGGKRITSVSDVGTGQVLNLSLADGRLRVRTEEVFPRIPGGRMSAGVDETGEKGQGESPEAGG